MLFSFWAEAVDQVFFAGQSYTSNNSSIDSSFKFTAKALSGTNADLLNQQLVRNLSKNQKYQYVSDALGNTKNSNKATALALALDGELVSIEKIGASYKLLYELSAQALYFDFYEKQVLGGYPFTLSFVEVFNQKPSDAQIQNAINGYLAFNGQSPLVTEFISVVGKSEIPNPANKRIRVKIVTIDQSVKSWLSNANQFDDLAVRYGNEFGKYLGKNQNISVLPASTGRAIGNEMAARFANGDVFQLKIPDEDYSIDISIKGFKKVEASKTNVATVFIYGAFTEISVSEPMSGKNYFMSPVKLGASKTVPISQANTDDWAAMNETLIQLFDEFTSQITIRNKDWQSSHLGSNKTKELESLHTLIEKCK